MRKIKTALSTTIVAVIVGITAPTAWGGLTPPPPPPAPEIPAIDTTGAVRFHDCAIFDSNGKLWRVRGGSTQVIHATEAGSGNVNAVCSGKDDRLVRDYTGKGSIQFDPSTHYIPCGIDPNITTYVETYDWHYVLTNKGNFTLTCHYKPVDVQ